MFEVNEYPSGSHVIRVGDRVRIRAAPGRRKGFDAVVRAIRIDETISAVREVEVFGGPPGRAMFRTFRPDRIERVARHRQVERRNAAGR